jgi:threonine aldolase
MGKEAALLVASGTMGNLVSLMAHGGHGDEVIVDHDAHIYWYEQGALCSIAGYTPRLVPSKDGLTDPKDIESAIRPSNLHFPVPRVLSLENTHNRGGGRVVPPPLFADCCAVARQHGLKIHLDGARIFNAAVACAVDVKVFAKLVDSVQFCLSKGLSAPIGSVVAGEKAFIERARRARKRLGGGLRQAGIIAAAGIVALQEGPKRLHEDHANAKLLASLIEPIEGLKLVKTPVTSNMVFVEHAGLRGSTAEIVEDLRSRGLRVISTSPKQLRLVTNRMVNEQGIRRAAEILAELARKRVNR